MDRFHSSSVSDSLPCGEAQFEGIYAFVEQKLHDVSPNFSFRSSTHFSDMFGAFEEFYSANAMSDVMVSVRGKTFNAHRIVLSAGSDYFRSILTGFKDSVQIPVLVINDISPEDIESMIEFLYRGQIVVTRNRVENLQRAASHLRIKGFEDFLQKPFSDSRSAFTGLPISADNLVLSIQHKSPQQQVKPSSVSERKRKLNTKQQLLQQQMLQEQQQQKISNDFVNFCKQTQKENQFYKNVENIIADVQDLNMNSTQKKVKTEQNRRFAETNNENEGISEVNYTYHMDPTVLSLGGSENGDFDHEMEATRTAAQSSSDFNDEDEYDSESIANSENQAKLAMMFNPANLTNLVKQNSLSGPEQFLVCEKCPEKQYFDEKKLQLHVKRAHGVNKMNVCNICGKTYAWKSDLHKRHVHNISYLSSGKKLNPVNKNVMVLGGVGVSDNQSIDSSTEATSPPMTPTELVSPPSMTFLSLFANGGTAEAAAAEAPAEVATASFSLSPPSMDAFDNCCTLSNLI